MDLDESQLARLGIAMQLLLGQSNISAVDLINNIVAKMDNGEGEILYTTLVQQILKNETMTAEHVHATLSRFKSLPHTNNAYTAAAVLIVLGIFATLTVALRFYSRAGRIRADDWVILVTLVLGLTMTMHFNVMVRRHGVGRHTWDNSFTEVRLALLLVAWIFSEIYLIAVSLIKLSFLVFYYKLGQAYRFFRWAVLFSGAFVMSWLVVQLVIIIRICTPINYWDHLITAKCLNRAVVYYVASAVNITQDLVILILPIYVVRRLNLSRREKMLVMSLFGLGGVVCIISIVKMFFAGDAATNFDFTQSQTIFNALSQVEVHLGVICCSIPSLRQMFSRSRQRISVQFQQRKSMKSASTGPSIALSAHTYHDIFDTGGAGGTRNADVELDACTASTVGGALRDSYLNPPPERYPSSQEASSSSSPPRDTLHPPQRHDRILSVDRHIASFEELEREMGMTPRQNSQEGSEGGQAGDSARSNKSSTRTQVSGRLKRMFSSGS